MSVAKLGLTARDEEILIDFARSHRIARLSVFGSRARGEALPNSDVDLLVRFSEPVGLYRHIEFESELAEKLGVPVDLVSEAALHRSLRQGVERDLRVLYESQ